MTKSTVQSEKDKDSLPEGGAAAKAAFPELFKAENPIIVEATKPKKTLSLETAGSELYAAVMNGEVNNVRGQLAHGDRVTENEAAMMIRVRDKAREKSIKRHLQAILCAADHVKSGRKENTYYARYVETSQAAQQAKVTAPVARVAMADVFEGRYTASGYELPDGSFLGTGGEFFNALNRILTLSDGKAFKLADDLDVSVAEVMRTAQRVRAVRTSAPETELEYVPAKPAAAAVPEAAPVVDTRAAHIEIVADIANIAAKAADDHAAKIMATKEFETEAKKAPGAAITQLDGAPGLSAEDIHIAIQLHRRAMRERRTGLDTLTEQDCREILDIRDGISCVDTSSMKRIRYRGEDRDGISVSFNPASREPVMITAVTEVGRSLKGCFRKASNGDKPKATCPSKRQLAVA